MHLLPLSLGRVADLTDPKGSSRFALNGVSVRLHGDNTFTAAATDCKRLIRVSGPCAGDPAEYPAHAGMDAAPNGRLDAIVPGDVWRKAFAAAEKGTRKFKTKPALRSVAVKIGPDLATFGHTDTDTYPTDQTRLVDGRFPPVADIIPRPGTGKDRFWVDPIALADTLRAVAAVGCDPGDAKVEVETNGTKVLSVRAVRADGVRVDALVMPLSIKPDGTAADADDLPDGAGGDEDTLAELTRLRAALAAATARGDRLEAEKAAEAASWRQAVADRDETIRGMQAGGPAGGAGVADLTRKLAAARQEAESYRRTLEELSGI